MAGLSMPSGCRAGRRASSSGRLDGDSSKTIASSASRSATAAKTCPARSGSPGPGGSGGSGRSNGSGGAVCRAATAPASAEHIAPGGARTARSAVLRCTSAASWLITTTVVPGSTNGPGEKAYCRNAGAPTAITRSYGSSAWRRRGRSAPRCPANSR